MTDAVRHCIVFSLILTLIVFSCTNTNDEKKNMATPTGGVSFLGSSTILFVSKEDAASLLYTSDTYSKILNSFDIQSKTQNTSSTQELDYLSYASSNAQAWTEDEINQTKAIIASSEKKIRALGLQLNLPSEIKLVKSSMKEEGGAQGYTRLDYIVLSGTPTEALFTHELFHIYSRANTAKRDELYRTINFVKCNTMNLPSSLNDNRITNPDAPFLEHFITVEIDGKQKDVVFIIYANRAYSGGSFFDYLTQKLLFVEGDNSNKVPVLVNELPVTKDFSEATNLATLIGTNTPYNIHPEEILAEHFSFLVTGISVPDQVFLNRMKTVLQ